MSTDDETPPRKREVPGWLLVTGGMILLGTVNIVVGLMAYPDPPAEDEPPAAVTTADAGASSPLLDAGPTLAPTP